MEAVEQKQLKMALTMEELSLQLTKVLAGLSTASDMAKQNTLSCQELRVTTERMLKNQDNLSNKVDAVENQMLRMGTRITSLEKTIALALDDTTSPDGRGDDDEIQSIAHERALETGAFHKQNHHTDPSSSKHAHSHNPRHNREAHQHDFRMPKTSFPKFDGSHPKLWKEKQRSTSICFMFLKNTK